MRCAECSTDKPPDQFTNSQKKRPAASRKCSACAADVRVSGAAHAVDASLGRNHIASTPFPACGTRALLTLVATRA